MAVHLINIRKWRIRNSKKAGQRPAFFLAFAFIIDATDFS